jgi:hypothetical protein
LSGPPWAFNQCAAISLVSNTAVHPTSLALAKYMLHRNQCYHFVHADPWQMSIFVKNWAIAGGLFALQAKDAAYVFEPERSECRPSTGPEQNTRAADRFAIVGKVLKTLANLSFQALS